MTTKTPLSKAKRLVLKIGSSLLVNEATGQVKNTWLNALADDILTARERGQQIIIVTSGAVAVGRRALGLPAGKLLLPQKQAAAAVGQIRLAHYYQEVLAERGLNVAQILLTLDDSEDRKRYLNARNTLNTLLDIGTIPVINENDTVATSEIKVGDNDRLAARVAQMASADALVIFSDIEGLYTANPRKDPTAKLIPVVEKLTPEIEAMADGAGSSVGTGGMATKLMAARLCMEAGCDMAIALGSELHPLTRMEKTGKGTWFLADKTPVSARKAWIGGAIKPRGTLVLDAGAVKALDKGKSLLPAGIKAVKGNFDRGDAVVLEDETGVFLGKGLTAYNAKDAKAIAGKHSDEIETVLGYHGPDEIIHRDDLFTEKRN
ncbi:MAG: glutamate 5-kinase [Alphaproteobacteria bacterium]|nr:glutamate 5-kinase [Alphaproteobacteria bacterium]